MQESSTKPWMLSFCWEELHDMIVMPKECVWNALKRMVERIAQVIGKCVDPCPVPKTGVVSKCEYPLDDCLFSVFRWYLVVLRTCPCKDAIQGSKPAHWVTRLTIFGII